MTVEQVLRQRNPETYRGLKLSRTKRRGRPLKTLEGRENSHEELLRGLVEHQAIRDAS